MEIKSLSKCHVVVVNDRDIFNERRGPVKCVYIINGLYIGSTNDLKRRIREYIGRARRNEPVRSETPIMEYIKSEIYSGNTIRFCILDSNPNKEFLFIKRITKRGVRLLNVKMIDSYSSATSHGKQGRYKRLKDTINYNREILGTW